MSINNNNNDYVAISTKRGGLVPGATYYCNSCNCNLIVLDAHKGEYWCNRCHLSYFPDKQQVRRANKFETAGDSRDKIPPMAMIDDSAATYARPTKSTFPKSLEHLKRPGVNITDFNSTVDNEGLE